jgi:hypothetical protein
LLSSKFLSEDLFFALDLALGSLALPELELDLGLLVRSVSALTGKITPGRLVFVSLGKFGFLFDKVVGVFLTNLTPGAAFPTLFDLGGASFLGLGPSISWTN